MSKGGKSTVETSTAVEQAREFLEAIEQLIGQRSSTYLLRLSS